MVDFLLSLIVITWKLLAKKLNKNIVKDSPNPYHNGN